jgi:hypothetical protein
MDVSGSMEGPRIQAARAALTLALRSLPEGALFNVLFFHTTHSAALPSAFSLPLSDATLAAATQWGALRGLESFLQLVVWRVLPVGCAPSSAASSGVWHMHGPCWACPCMSDRPAVGDGPKQVCVHAARCGNGDKVVVPVYQTSTIPSA